MWQQGLDVLPTACKSVVQVSIKMNEIKLVKAIKNSTDSTEAETKLTQGFNKYIWTSKTGTNKESFTSGPSNTVS